MPQTPTISVSQNVATISLPKGWATNVAVEVKSNSSLDQHVELDIDGTKKTIKGTGEQASLETLSLPEGTSKLVATFSHGSDKKPSELQHGGPWDIGTMQLLMVLAENGDDEDFNDVVLQVRGVVGK
jgi:hypothetical protein